MSIMHLQCQIILCSKYHWCHLKLWNLPSHLFLDVTCSFFYGSHRIYHSYLLPHEEWNGWPRPHQVLVISTQSVESNLHAPVSTSISEEKRISLKIWQNVSGFISEGIYWLSYHSDHMEIFIICIFYGSGWWKGYPEIFVTPILFDNLSIVFHLDNSGMHTILWV